MTCVSIKRSTPFQLPYGDVMFIITANTFITLITFTIYFIMSVGENTKTILFDH